MSNKKDDPLSCLTDKEKLNIAERRVRTLEEELHQQRLKADPDVDRYRILMGEDGSPPIKTGTFGAYFDVSAGGADCVVLAVLTSASAKPWSVKLPHQVYVRDVIDMLVEARSIEQVDVRGWTAYPVTTTGRVLVNEKPDFEALSNRDAEVEAATDGAFVRCRKCGTESHVSADRSAQKESSGE